MTASMSSVCPLLYQISPNLQLAQLRHGPFQLIVLYHQSFPKESPFSSLESRPCLILLVSFFCIFCCQLIRTKPDIDICFNMATCYVFLITDEGKFFSFFAFSRQILKQTTEYVPAGTMKGPRK